MPQCYDGLMTRRSILASELPEGWHSVSSSRHDGLVAEFWPDGHLRRLACYHNGNCRDAWELRLDEHEESGRAVLENGSGGTADWVEYRNGKSETFDAWSDNSPAQTVDFVRWVRDWIERVARSATRQRA